MSFMHSIYFNFSTVMVIFVCLFGALPSPSHATLINLKEKLAVPLEQQQQQQEQQQRDEKILSATDLYCTKNTWARQTTSRDHICRSGYSLSGTTCVQPCQSGYTSVGGVCWQNCPDGYTDQGAFCSIPYDSYLKGCCCILGNCCNFGCRDGYHDDGGCSCVRPAQTIAKNSYTQNSYPSEPRCPTGFVSGQVADTTCLSVCPSGYSTIGGIEDYCYQNCPHSFSIDTGLFCEQASGAATPSGLCPFN